MRRSIVRIVGIIAWATGAALVLILIGECTLYLQDVFAEKRAASLLQDVKSLKVGESTEEDLQAVVTRYGGVTHFKFDDRGCIGPTKLHSLRLANATSNSIGLRFPAVRVFGDRLWQVDVFLASAQDRVCHVRYQFQPMPRKGTEWLDLSSSASMETSPDGQSYAVGLRRIHNVRSLSAELFKGASDEQRTRAFDMDLSCLTRWAGCHNVCEVMPSAWIDYVKKAREQDLPIPPDETGNPHCKRLAAL